MNDAVDWKRFARAMLDLAIAVAVGWCAMGPVGLGARLVLASIALVALYCFSKEIGLDEPSASEPDEVDE